GLSAEPSTRSRSSDRTQAWPCLSCRAASALTRAVCIPRQSGAGGGGALQARGRLTSARRSPGRGEAGRAGAPGAAPPRHLGFLFLVVLLLGGGAGRRRGGRLLALLDVVRVDLPQLLQVL